MRQISIYDMDKTITRRATYTPFLIHAVLTRAPWRLILLPFVLVTILAYGLRVIDRARLKEANQRLLLGPHIHPDELAPIVDSFAERTMRTNVLAGAVERIGEERAEGRHLVLATASYRLYVEAIARRLGFDDIVATNTLAGLDTRIMARIDGENCYGPAKLRMVTAWLHDAGVARADAHIRFYSDHASDEPALAWADEAFAVNPHGPLRTLAGERGWRIIDWR